ncbi:glutathione S-transferase N-terminal domain-containing protein [Puniceicoccaceae bacterium K14]|nr:glutathione S-transferase N-terminal domain-containing protein [Puniceicoccaceae bacterium K14]
MKKIEIYSADTCPYCQQAKQLLDRENIPYDEIKIQMVGGRKIEDANFKKMKQRALGQTTVPQIIIDNEYYGDDDTLVADIKKNRFHERIR